MTSEKRRVGVMLELSASYKRHTDLYAGFQQYAYEQDWETIIDEYADDSLPTGRGQQAPYDGIVARATRKLAERAGQLQVPVVNVWLNSPVRDKLPGVFCDFSLTGKLRAEHLLDRGFERFGALATNTAAPELELRSFRDTVTSAGYPCVTDRVPLDPDKSLANWRKSEKAIASWIERLNPPVGVYVSADSYGRMVAQICRSRGLSVPGDVAIIAGNNEETLCEHPQPSLTSVEIGFERIGYESGRLLHSMMDGKAAPKTHLLLPPSGLVVRESTDFFAVKDPLVASALAYISANSHRRIGPDKVATAVNAETRTLQMRFRKFLNRPIAAEIRRVRIERAKRELAQSKRRLSEIARDVGFGETMRMYEVFRRELGVTPSEYRKQRQLQNAT